LSDLLSVAYWLFQNGHFNRDIAVTILYNSFLNRYCSAVWYWTRPVY